MDTKSREYTEWVANVWRLNHLRNQAIEEQAKAAAERKKHSRGMHPRVKDLKLMKNDLI